MPCPEPPGHDSCALTHPGLITNTGLACGCKGSFTTTFLVSLEIFLKKHKAQGASCSRVCHCPPDSASRPGRFGPATQLQETPRVKALVGGKKPHTRSGALQNFNPARSKLHWRTGGHTELVCEIPKEHPQGTR